MATANTWEFPDGHLPYLEGNIDMSAIPALRTKEIRVYLSCTHTDMQVERTALMECIYPVLREYCSDKFSLEFHVIDLRWGLKEELDDDDPYRQLYGIELDQCLRLSEGPNFVILVGQRYGERPIPLSIPATEFEMIKDVLHRSKSRHARHAPLLDFWYVLDENASPPMYFLQPRSQLSQQCQAVPLLSRDGLIQNLTWGQTKMTMQRLLQLSAVLRFKEGTILESDMSEYGASDLDREGQAGVLGNIDPVNKCLMLARNIVDLQNYISHPQAAKFIDVIYNEDDREWRVDQEARANLDTFKNRILRRSLPEPENVGTFDILWKFENGVDIKQHASYIKDICSAFCDKLKVLINREARGNMSKENESNLPTLLLEVMEHWQETKQILAEGFVGRTEVLNIIKQYVTGSANKLLVITGPSGSGKTSLLCKVAAEAFDWMGDDCVTVLRHLGLPGGINSSGDICQVLIGICTQLGFLLRHDKSRLPSAMPELQNYFFQILKEWPSNRSLLILLDSLDSLMPHHQAHFLQWLPTELNDNVKIVVTTLPDKHGILNKLRLEVLQDDSQILDIPPLSGPEALELLLQLLQARGDAYLPRCRTLCEAQQEQVLQILTMCGWPLYVKLLCEDAARWRSTDKIPLSTLPCTMAMYMEHFLEHLEVEHGKILVSHSLAYMAASFTGLSDAEMEDVLSLDDSVLDEVQLSGATLPLRRLPQHRWLRLKDHISSFLVHRYCEGFSVYFLAHNQFKELIFDHYLFDDNAKKVIHSVLADYYLGIWSDQPKPYNCVLTQNNNSSQEQPETQRLKCLSNRFVSSQNLIYSGDCGRIAYNKRKYDQLPRHLLLSGRMKELNKLVLFNYEWLYSKTKALSFQHVLTDFVLSPGVETALVERALRDAQKFVEVDIDTLGVELSGRLLAYYRTHPNIRQLIQQADKAGVKYCGLIPNFPYYQVPGSPLKHTLTCHHPPTSFALGGPNHSLLLTKMATDPMVQVYDLLIGEHVHDIATSVGDMHITPSGTRLVIIDRESDKSIKVHSAETGKFIGQLIPLNQITLEPKGKYRLGPMALTDTHIAFIVTADTSYLFVADVEICRFLEVQGLDGRASLCHLTPDGQYVFVNSNNFIMSFDLYTGERVCNIELEYKPVQVLTTESGLRGFLINEEENKVYIIYLRDGHIEFIYKVVVSEYMESDKIVHMALSRNQKQLLVRGSNNLVVYNTVSERIIAHFPRPDNIPLEFKLPKQHYANIYFTQADFSPDDKFVIATIFRHIYIWNVSTNQLLTLLQAPVGIIENLLIPSERTQIVTHHKDNKDIHVWSLGDAIGHVGTLDRLTTEVKEIKISQNDRKAFIRCKGSDEIGVLDMRTGYLVDLLTHPSPVISFSLTPNAEYALVATEPALKTNTANQIWYMEGRKVIYEFGNVGAHSVTLQQENCLISIGQEESIFKAPYQIKLFTFQEDQFEECRLSYEVKFLLVEPFVTLADKYLVMLTADDYSDYHALHINPTICAISLKANMAVSTFSVKDLCDTVSMKRILSVRPYGHNSYTIIAFYTNEPDLSEDGSRPHTYVHCYGFMIFDVCSGVVCQIIPDLMTPQTALDQLIFTQDVSLCIDPESHIFDMGTGYFLKRLTTTSMRPRCLGLNGRVVLYAEGSCLLAIRLADGKQVGRVNIHGTVTTLEMCHDERTLLLGCADGSLLSYVLVDAAREESGPSLANVTSRQDASAFLPSPTCFRSWDKVEKDVIPCYSRPPSACSVGPSDKDLLQTVKPLSRSSPTSGTILYYGTSRSRMCAVM